MSEVFDSIIVGGGAAGMQAALTLGRTGRAVMLVDARAPRNRFSERMHNVLGADGLTLPEFYARALGDLAKYPNLTVLEGTITRAQKEGDGFVLEDAAGGVYRSRTVLLAGGIQDGIPDIEGIGPLWGTKVLHCAYCHGYEVKDAPLGLLISPQYVVSLLEATLHLSRDITVYFHGEEPDEALRALLARAGLASETAVIARLEEDAQGVRVTLADGRPSVKKALFLKPGILGITPLVEMLGCELRPEGVVKLISGWGETSVPGVYAAGDLAFAYNQLGSAMASGLTAAVRINAVLNRQAMGL